jgi:glycoside/pentoside/hexuronide:cation symporter, GPH family
MSAPRSSVALSTKILYGFGSIAFGVKDTGFGFFLLLYYNQVAGLPQSWVGLGIMVALLFDSIADPVVGYVSDHLHSRWGRRHPFMYASAIPVGVAYLFLFNPPQGLSDGALLAYFVGVAILVRLFITLYEIPSTALVAELTDDYDERTSLLGYRFFFGWWGGLTMGVLAYSFFLQPDAEHPVGVLNQDGYRRYGIASAVLMMVSILVSAVGTHRHIPNLRRPPESVTTGFGHAIGELRETFSNRSFRVLFVSAIFWAMAAGLTAALNIYFNTYFWELASSQISILVLGNFPAAAVALVVSQGLSKRLGKKRAAVWIATLGLVFAPVPILLRLVGWMPENGSAFLVPILFAHSSFEVCLIIIASILVTSMVADVVEESELSTGRRSEGVFFAARSFIEKSVSGVGVFTSTLLLAAIGFPADAKPGAVDPAVIRALGLAYVPILLFLYGAGIAFIGTYRIDRETHAENLRRLAAQAEPAPAALTGSDA